MGTSSSSNSAPNVRRVDASVMSVIRLLVEDPRLNGVRIVTAVGVVLGLAELLGVGFWPGCGIMVFQSVVVPTAVGYLVLERGLDPAGETRLSTAVVAGTLTGAALAIYQTLIGSVHYFALGGEAQLFAARGLPQPPLTFGGLMAVIYSDLYILLALAIVSALAALVGGILGRHRRAARSPTVP